MSKPTIEAVSTIEIVSMVEARPLASMTGPRRPVRLARDSPRSAVRVLTATGVAFEFETENAGAEAMGREGEIGRASCRERVYHPV